jgi:hypothetical protein
MTGVPPCAQLLMTSRRASVSERASFAWIGSVIGPIKPSKAWSLSKSRRCEATWLKS